MSNFKKPDSYKPIIYSDDYVGYSTKLFSMPQNSHHYLDSLLIPQGIIAEQAERVTKQMYDDWDGQPLVLVTVMNGGARFAELIIRSLNKISYISTHEKPYQIGYLQCVNYNGDKQLNSKDEKLIVSPSFPKLKNKDVVDTGHSMCNLINWAKKEGAISAKCLTMTTKRTKRSNGYIPDYSCFEIFDHWIVGFGLDFNNYFRNYDHIYILSDKAKIELSNQN